MGRVVGEFRSSWLNIGAGYFLAAFLGASASVLLLWTAHAVWQVHLDLPWDADRGWSWVAVFGSIVANCVLLWFAVSLLCFTNKLASQTIYVCEEGISVCKENNTCDIRWDEIERIVEVEVSYRLPILHFPVILLLPKRHSLHYEIWVFDKPHPHLIDKNAVPHIVRFRKLVVRSCHGHMVTLLRRIDSSI